MIPYSKPSITKLEIKYVSDAIKSGWGKNCYKYIEKFEKKFSRSIGSKFSHATSSCTGALHLGLSALGIKRGDEVIVSDINWIATVAPIIHLGAKPVLVDINLDNWCLNVDDVNKSINSKTKAIIATHLYGNIAEIEKLKEISKRKKIFFIEDSAEGLGSYYYKKHVGTFGDFGVFSFHGTKTMTTGEGGMLITNNEMLYKKVLELNNHGRKINERRAFWPTYIGYKFKMSNLQAALGLAQIERFPDLIKRKKKILDIYKKLLVEIPNIYFNQETENIINGSWMPTFFVNNRHKIRDKLIKIFKKEKIDARPTFWPLSTTDQFKKLNIKNKNANFFQDRSINLPSFHDITLEQQTKVANLVKKIILKK